MTKVATATEEMSDLRRLCSIATKAANSQTIDGVDRCVDILGYLKNLSFSAKDLVRVTKEISSLASLRDHRNPKISMEAKALFTSWMKTLYSRDPSPCNNNTKLVKKTPAADAALPEKPRSQAHEAVEIKQQKSVKKNSTETLELFEIAKKSADVASAKGILLSTKETSICVDTLSLLSGFPISSTAPETKKMMDKLSYLTKHKDRKICNSATALLQHWRQSITAQQQRDALKTQD